MQPTTDLHMVTVAGQYKTFGSDKTKKNESKENHHKGCHSGSPCAL